MERSQIMRRVKGQHTGPELCVRQLLRALGFSGYRLHRKELPGKPDIVFIGRRKAIFVHGCFWHGHDCKRGARMPQQNAAYWQEKIHKNRQRDAAHCAQLAALGWQVLTVWECTLRDGAALAHTLRIFLQTPALAAGPDG
ncbi:very short patch repair endonuclease [Massilia sp. W12]|uniref:very short patch repair endonuclease n=1 Tax=Massilia sp. W12 TaxID=3126507 RepID=UPI0030CFAE78